MNKKWIIKAVGVTAATAVLMVSVYGCSMVKMMYSDITKADKAAYESTGAVEYVGFDDVDTSAQAAESGVTEVHSVDGTVQAIAEEAAGGASVYNEDDPMEQYADSGLEYSAANGEWWYGEKPIMGIYDADNFTMTNGNFKGIGALLVVDRNRLGAVTGIREVTEQEFAEACGLTFDSSLEQDCKSEGYAFYTEDTRVKDMSAQELAVYERQLYAKYRHQDAVVQCLDYTFRLDREATLKLSTFCGADMNHFGVTVYADYDIADEIDIAELDTVQVDHVLLELLQSKTFENARELEAQAKKAVAQHYGISQKNLVAVASLIS